MLLAALLDGYDLAISDAVDWLREKEYTSEADALESILAPPRPISKLSRGER
jgi:hypothetical protein